MEDNRKKDEQLANSSKSNNISKEENVVIPEEEL